MRANRNLLNRFNLICLVQSRAQKQIASSFPQSMASFHHPGPARGAYASSRTLGRGCDGRESVARAGDRRAGQLVSGRTVRRTSGVVADGEVVWSWHPLLVSSSRRQIRPDRVWTSLQSADDGGKRNSSPGRARRKPLKPLRREGRMIPPTPVVSTPVLFCCTGGRGCGGHPAFPAPSVFRRDKFDANLGRIAPRDGARVCLSSSLRAKRSNPESSAWPLDCFASLAMTGRLFEN